MENKRRSVSLMSNASESSFHQENIHLKCELEKCKVEIQRKTQLIQESIEMLDSYDRKLRKFELKPYYDQTERMQIITDQENQSSNTKENTGAESKAKIPTLFHSLTKLCIPIALTFLAVGLSSIFETILFARDQKEEFPI